jgi:diacylglycerol kinase (ATP)
MVGRVLVVTNELAGRTEADAIADAVRVLEEAGEGVEVVTCHAEEDLERFLDRRGSQTVVVVGGDGSLHTLLRHLWRRGEAQDCPLGLIPLGTGNDFARGVGIPIDPVAAAKLIVDGETRKVDLIVDEDNGVVVNAVHVGVGAEAAHVARPLKRWLRIAAFPIGAILAGARAKGWRLKITVDGKILTDGRQSVLMAGIANARTIAGGTAELGPEASPVDGVADVTVSYAVGPLARIGYALALRRGRHPERDDVQHLTGRDVEVSGGPFHVNADGELTGPVTHKRWRVVPHAWRLVLGSMSTVESQGAEPQLAEDFHRNP